MRNRIIRCLGMFISLVSIMLSASAYSEQPIRVLFINPGHASESFWQEVDQYSIAAADALGIELDIRHASRNHFAMRQILSARLNKRPLPNYVIIVNEKLAANHLFPILRQHPIYVQVILNDIDADVRANLLSDPHWQQYLLPSVIPDNRYIGEKTADAMVKAGHQQPGEAVMISGDLTTPASVAREAGARDYFKSHKQIELMQVVHGQWDEAISYEQMGTLLQRYPALRYVWTANDHMAFGAIKAAQEMGKKPGEDIFFATINTSAQVLALREQGTVSALGGGHFSAGGLALTRIYAHAKGLPLPLLCADQLFQLIEPNTSYFSFLQADSWHRIPFKKMARQPRSHCGADKTERNIQ